MLRVKSGMIMILASVGDVICEARVPVFDHDMETWESNERRNEAMALDF